MLPQLNTSTASSFFADPTNDTAANAREPIACSSPRRLNETQLDSSEFFHSMTNDGFENDDDNIDEIELTGAVGNETAAATGNAAAASASDEEDEVFNANTFL